jgi:ribose transport system substrate-binding protein
MVMVSGFKSCCQALTTGLVNRYTYGRQVWPNRDRSRELSACPAQRLANALARSPSAMCANLKKGAVPPMRALFRQKRYIGRLLVLAALVGLVAACSSGGSSSSSPSTGTTTNTSAAPSSQSADSPGVGSISLVPQQDRKYYGQWQGFSTLLADPYKSWTPPKPPWKICYNESYLGNAWRQESLSEFKKLLGEYQSLGLAKSGAPNVTNSNNATPVELSQLDSQVSAGCQVIIVDAGSPTGLCSGLKNAFVHNVLVVIEDSTVYCPYAVNVTLNTSYQSIQAAQFIATALHGKGNVVLEAGIPGISLTNAEVQSATGEFKKYPGIHILGQISGQWTPSIAKAAMLSFITTHPQPINGVWDSGQMDVAAEQALQQSGRPLAVVNSFSSECSFMAFWKQYHLNSSGFSGGGSPAMYEAYEIAVRMLYGAKPAVSTIMYPLPAITKANFNQYYKPSMTLQSTCFANPPNNQAVPNSFFDSYLTGGSAVPHQPVG